jgi:hypothetical protein
VTEIPLAGGDMNPVVRVGDTVRRPPLPDGVRALLRWYGRVGFDGAPRFLGTDEQGRDVLSFVAGEAAFPPVRGSDDAIVALGQLLRRAHDAQNGFQPPAEPGWLRPPQSEPEVIAHLDLYWTNVILRDGIPAALIDWELAAPATRVLEVALAATYWAGLRLDEQLVEWGLPLDRRGERLRLLCDAYGLDRRQRKRLLEELIGYRRHRVARQEWRGTTPPELIRANLRWIEKYADELAPFLA